MTLPPDTSQQIFRAGLLAGEVAIVTGGGSGIGRAIASELVNLGARVAICGRTPDKLDRTCEELEQRVPGARIFAAACDIRDPVRVAEFVREAAQQLGDCTLLFNNAGGQFPSPAAAITPNGFAAVVTNNLNGTFHITREVAVTGMIPARRGRIINIIANIYRGFPGMVHTGAARAGVENMTMTLAVEWAPFGILVNAIAPGIIRSEGTDRYPPELLAQQVDSTPLQRIGTVAEVASAAIFLASPAAQFITGATLRVDGGQALASARWPPPGTS